METALIVVEEQQIGDHMIHAIICTCVQVVLDSERDMEDFQRRKQQSVHTLDPWKRRTSFTAWKTQRMFTPLGGAIGTI